MKKKKILIIVAAILLVIILGVAGVSFVYVNDYYHATDNAISYLESSENVNVSFDANKNITFRPNQSMDKHIGFIFYPGGKVEYTAYAPMLYKLAENGITCILIKMPANLAIMGINKADGTIDGYTDIDKWYIGGHSLGGAAASMYVYDHKQAFDGLVLLGAYSTKDISDTDLSVLLITGSEDKVLSLEKYNECMPNYPKNLSTLNIEGGCHSYFGDYGMQEGDGQPQITCEYQQDTIVDYLVEWFIE